MVIDLTTDLKNREGGFVFGQPAADDLMDTFHRRGESMREGLIKMKLAHARGFTVLLPDVLLINFGGDWRWFQPQFFTACQLSFLDEQAYGQLSIDLDEQVQALVGFTKDRFVRRFDDGSQLYACRVACSADLEQCSTGTCSLSEDHDILLDLFHHTLPQTVELIRETGHFRASAWNIQGTRELSNVGFAYFTSLPTIRSDNDLQAIAMASEGKIALLPTNARSRKDLVVVDVSRQNTLDRTGTIKVSVPAEIIASQHIYRHAPHGDPVYYECCHPAIARVGLKPGRVIPFDGTHLRAVGDEFKRFDYVVLGDADTREGLIAPYDEENTESTFLIERCGEETFFDFWQRNSNSDQVTGRFVERKLFK